MPTCYMKGTADLADNAHLVLTRVARLVGAIYHSASFLERT